MFGLKSAAAATIAQVLLTSGRPPDSTVWAIVAACVLFSDGFGAVALTAVTRLLSPDRQPTLLSVVVRSQLMSAGIATSLGVAGSIVIVEQAPSAPFLAGALIGLFALVRSLAQAAAESTNRRAVVDFSGELIRSTTSEDVAAIAIREATKLLRANHAVLVVPTAEDGRWIRVEISAEATLRHRPQRLPVSWVTPLEACLLKDIEIHDLAPLGLDSRSGGVLAPLPVAGRHGLFVVAERSADAGAFTTTDAELLAGLAAQTGIALDKSSMVDRLKHQAHHDELTKLPNRTGLAKAARSALRKHESVAFMLIDLDGFKDVNDTLSHAAGDRTLIAVGKRLRNALPKSHALGRLGGDEFAVIVPGPVDAVAAGALAAKLMEAIAQPVQIDDLSVELSASIGIVIAPEHGTDHAQLMSRADIAMYVAKNKHSGWEFYSPEDDTHSPRRLGLQSDLRRAIDGHELEVWYQPKVELPSGRLVGAEALARWKHSRYGYVPPEEFVSIAEASGLMRGLTHLVTDIAVRDAVRWLNTDAPVHVAVNLSTRNLLDDTLSDRIDEILTTHGLPSSLLTLEVTETSIMLDKDRVVAVLHDLSDQGITLAVDDYGTGYSSLAYLRELPVSELKVDRSFITDLDVDDHNEVIVRSTIEMGHNLGMCSRCRGHRDRSGVAGPVRARLRSRSGVLHIEAAAGRPL